jgi:hypothetical protein
MAYWMVAYSVCLDIAILGRMSASAADMALPQSFCPGNSLPFQRLIVSVVVSTSGQQEVIASTRQEANRLT